MKGLAILFILFIIGMFAMVVYNNFTEEERIYSDLKSQILADSLPEAILQEIESSRTQVKEKSG